MAPKELFREREKRPQRYYIVIDELIARLLLQINSIRYAGGSTIRNDMVLGVLFERLLNSYSARLECSIKWNFNHSTQSNLV